MTSPSHPRAAASKGKKFGLAAGAALVALVAAESIYRLVEQPTVGRGTIYAADGTKVPLGEILLAMGQMAETTASLAEGRTPPFGMHSPNLKLRMGYERPLPQWDYFDENGCIAIDTNRLGLRDAEFPVQKRPGEFRVLALGDSMTYGQGVRLDLTWPQVLEAALRAERKAPVEVINAGFATGPDGHSPAGYDRWVAEHGLLFAPDVVVVGLCLNDVGPVPMLTYSIVPREPVLGGFSHMLDAAVQYAAQRAARQRRTDFAAAIAKEPAAWQGTQRGLLALRDTLAGPKVPLVVAVFPMLSQLEPELYPCRPLHEMVVQFCAREGIHCVDLLPAFLGLVEGDLWVHPSDQHGNHTVHALQAERIHAFLREQGLLPANGG